MKAQIRVGNAPCSWGKLEFEGTQGEVPGFEQMLDELAETGYTGTELGDWGYMPTTPTALSEALTRRGLTMNGAFVPVNLRDASAHAAGIETAVQIARLLKSVATEPPPFLVLADDNGKDPVRTLNAGRIRPEMGLDEASWRTFARGVDAVAHAVSEETGLRTVFHHHCAGFVETHDEIERLLALTDRAVVGLVFDTGHYAFGNGGCDAIPQALDDFAERIWYIHLKDCSESVRARTIGAGWGYFDAVRHGIFCELGQGCVDFPGVRAWLERHNYQGFATVEQDILPGMGTPVESARRNRDYLRSIGL